MGCDPVTAGENGVKRFEGKNLLKSVIFIVGLKGSEVSPET